jgi:hypothetical protein
MRASEWVPPEPPETITRAQERILRDSGEFNEYFEKFLEQLRKPSIQGSLNDIN